MSWKGKRPLLTILTALSAGLAGAVGLAYLAWFKAGPWHALPQLAAPSYSQSPDPAFAEAADLAGTLLVEHRNNLGIPGITASVAYQGRTIWQGGAGWRSLDPPQPVSSDTQFRIGSTSKAVTATAAARLVDRDAISLDEPITTYLPDLPNPGWQSFTLRQLFSHTAGLPGYAENTDYTGGLITLCGCRRYASVRESLEIFDGSELLFEPGTDFHYSSFDTNLIGTVLAHQQQRTFLAVLQDTVFNPLGLTASSTDQQGVERPNIATFYEIRPGEAGVWPEFDLSQRWPGGGLVSTSVELALIGNAWLDPDFISPATRGTMWTPQLLANGEANKQSYALGWRFYTDHQSGERKLSYAHHGGVSKGAMSWLVVYPEHELSIAVNINTRAATFAEFASVERGIREAFLLVTAPR